MTKDIHQLSQLSLTEPEMVLLHHTQGPDGWNIYLDVDEITDTYETPVSLKQHYMVLKPDEKLDVLFSFLKTHLRDKILVFLSSCK